MLIDYATCNVYVGDKLVTTCESVEYGTEEPMVLNPGLEGFTAGAGNVAVEGVMFVPDGVMLGPHEIARGTLAFGMKGALVGQLMRCDVGIRGATVACWCVLTRIQPNDGDGPGFTDFVLYEW